MNYDFIDEGQEEDLAEESQGTDNSTPQSYSENTKLINPFVRIPLSVSQDFNLNSTDIRIYGALASHIRANSHGCCRPSIKRIAMLAGVCKRTAMRSLKKLSENGHIIKEHSFIKNGGNGANIYDLNPSDKVVTPLVTKLSPPSDKNVTPSRYIEVDNNINIFKNTRTRKKASPCSGGDTATGDSFKGSAGDKSLNSAILTSNDISIFTALKAEFMEIERDIELIKIGGIYKLRRYGKYALIEDIRIREIIEFLGKMGVEAQETAYNSRYQGELIITDRKEVA